MRTQGEWLKNLSGEPGLAQIGIEIDDKTASQYLFLLRNVGVVGDKHYGSRFYFSRELWKTHIDYAFKSVGTPFDRGEFMRRLETYYKSQKDKRLNASRAFIASLEGKK